MKYLLLSDIRFNNKVLKVGEISELKEIKDNIPQLLENKAIVPYTKEEIVKQAIEEAKNSDVEKIKDIIDETKEKIEADKAEKELAEDTGVDVDAKTTEPTDTTKARGRGRSKK